MASPFSPVPAPGADSPAAGGRWVRAVGIVLLAVVGLAVAGAVRGRGLWAHGNLGRAYYQGKQYGRASAEYTKAIAGDPTCALAYANRAATWCKRGDLDRADEELVTAVASLFGAPFWFDALQLVTRLKGSGPSPGEKSSNTAAAT